MAAWDSGQRCCATSARCTTSSLRPDRRAISAARTSRLGELRSVVRVATLVPRFTILAGVGEAFSDARAALAGGATSIGGPVLAEGGIAARLSPLFAAGLDGLSDTGDVPVSLATVRRGSAD